MQRLLQLKLQGLQKLAVGLKNLAWKGGQKLVAVWHFYVRWITYAR
jgi:hypothetical protein